jgi:DNA-binding transcriptional ArsR family regulator
MLETFRALAEPSRLQIVDLLLKGPLSVGQVVDQLGIRQPQASKHLHTLAQSGLVEVHPDAQRRVYALRAQPLKELDLWLQRYRQIWEEQFQRLDDVLEDLQANQRSTQETVKPKPKRHPSKAKRR